MSTNRAPVARRGRMTRLLSVAAGLLALLGLTRDAAANCQNGSTSQTVTWAVSATASGSTLNAVLNASTPPCVITVSPGTYAAPSAPPGDFTIATGITVRSSGGAATTTLRASNFAAVAIWPIAGSCPSGATLEDFTLEAPAGGVFVGAGTDISHPGCANNQVTGVTLRKLVVNRSTTPAGGHGLEFHGVQNSVIDSCSVVDAYANGIFLNGGSNNNIVMNSAIQRAQTQHAIAVQTSNNNTIVGNTVSGGPFFDGVILNSNVGLAGPGSSGNRIERNLISGHRVDGIVLTDASLANYIGLNVAASASYSAPNASTNPGANGGVGVWVNNGSNAAYVYGNDLSGSAENGIDVMRSKSIYIQGNSVHGNYQGGIWVANVPDDANIDHSAPVPRDITVHGNSVFFNRLNAQLFLQGTINSNAAFNYLSGALGGAVNGNATVGVRLQGAVTTTAYENTVSQVGSRVFINDLGGPATSGAVFFRNRFLKGTNVPNPPQTDGLNGVTYALTPSTWDGGSFLGGNHWSEFAATGNPDPTHPYTGFIGNVGGGPNVDRFPFQSETLQLPLSIPNSVTVLEPVSGAVLAAGTPKSIRWIARGCALVDIYYGVGSNLTLLAAGFPNTGDFIWTVPAAAFGTTYHVQVVCADSNDVPFAGVNGSSPQFTIASGNLVLMTPGRGSRVVNGSVVRVAWKKSPTVANVSVFVKAGTGSETAFGPFSGTFADVTLPGSVSNSNHVTVRIQNAGAAQDQDSVNGYFMVRGAAPAFTTDLANTSLQVGSIQFLEWVGPSNSYTVDLDLVGGITSSIARNLPDFGSYTWFVADASSSSATIRVTFRDANGNALGSQVTSPTFGVSRYPGATPTAPGRAVRQDLDGDSKTDIVVFRPSNGTWYVRYSSLGFSAASYGQFQWGLPGDMPITGDFDGDGKTELAVWRPSDGTWYIRYSSLGYNVASYAAFQWGLPGDIPIAADFDGDGKTELAVWRPSDGTWYIRYSSLGYNVASYAAFQWGLPGDMPITGDFDGDGKTELAVWRPSDGTWYIRYSSLGYNVASYATFQWGLPGDMPITGDFDGDGKTELAVWRPANGTWYIRYSSLGYNLANFNQFQWGLPGDVPVVEDLDGDGKAELAVFRPGPALWFIRYSSQGYNLGGYEVYQWGLAQDLLVN